MKRVKCTVSFYYDPETYIFTIDEEEPDVPNDEEILRRCREYFVEDITSQDDPFLPEFVNAEFVDADPDWMDESYTCSCGIYVHSTRRNYSAIHIADCPYSTGLI